MRALYDFARLNFVLFPGIARPTCADFLAPYYRYYAQAKGPLFVLRNAIVWVGFCLYVPVRARMVAAKWQKDAAWVRRAIRWGRRHFTDPSDIAAHNIENEASFRFYQRRFEQVFVIRAIERDSTDHLPELIDKAFFQSHCEAHGLPIPRGIAVIERGEVAFLSAFEPGEKILIKPSRGSGGACVHTARPADDGQFRALVERHLDGRWLMQQAMTVHPALADLALDALPTARIITLLNERGQPEIVSSSIRFATIPGVPVDNNKRGGLSALIDPATGELGEPIEIEGPAVYDRHPATGSIIAGRTVPDWESAAQLALEAHARAFARNVLIGWDIGFSDEGPVLIEANQRPNVRLTQRIERKGIGEMRYGELLQLHLDRAISEGWTGRRRLLTRG